MKLEPQHLKAVNLLIDGRFTGRSLNEIAEELDISVRTLHRWRMDANFQKAYDRAERRWAADLWVVSLAARKSRLLEFERMYRTLPDFHITRVIETKSPIIDSAGKTITDADGRPITTLAVYRSNAPAKIRILNQIAEEVGDKNPKVEPDDEFAFSRRVRLLIQQGNERTGGADDDAQED